MKELLVVHKTEVKKLFDKLKLESTFASGYIKCEICACDINTDNFGAYIKIQKKNIFSCSKINCLMTFLEMYNL